MSETTYKLDFGTNYKPDILSCLADLSSDEVFTPPEIANALLDLLPKEIWSNPNIKILDPACKTGIFLREAAKRFLEGEKDIYPDLHMRINHIFQEQLYGIAITELTSLISRRSVYCSKYPNGPFSISKFDSADGNIRFKNTPHVWSNGKCAFCSAAQNQFGEEQRAGRETHAYEFIHLIKPEEIFNMKFDVICSNPPYQLSDGGAGASAMPIYNKFVEQAKKLNPRYITMIIPSRWYAGGRALTQFRDDMLNDQHISSLIDFQQSRDCFPGLDIAGGVCYFLWERDFIGKCNVYNKTSSSESLTIRTLNEYSVFVRDNVGIDIIHRIKSMDPNSINEIMVNYNPFLIRSFVKGAEKPFKNSVELHSSKGISYIDRSTITKNTELIDKYKVVVGKVTSEHAGFSDKNGQYRVLSSLQILNPGEVCSESYVVMGAFEKENDALRLSIYLKSKLIRFLILQAATSINLTKDTFMFAPLKPFVNGILSDSDLYSYFKLTKEEIDYVESLIKEI